MSNEVIIPAAPAYLAALIAANPSLALINADALSGSAKPMPPTIVADKGRFIKKQDGEEITIVFPATMPNGDAHPAAGQPIAVLQGVVLKAKPGKEKAWYATAYTPGQETQSPDCFSDDGVKPDPSCRLKQCDNCASCPQNVFGSGTKQDGSPSDGKACADRKVTALFAAGSAYRFAVPPASLKNWDSYCNQLTTKGLPLPAVITIIGFEQGDTAYKLTFAFGGMLAEAQLGAVVKMLDAPEVKDIVSPRNAQTAITHTPATSNDSAVGASELEQARQKKEAEDKAKAAVEDDKKTKAAAAKAKKDADAAAKKAAETTGGGLDLGLGLGDGGAAAGATPGAAAGPSDEDLINSLGL